MEDRKGISKNYEKDCLECRITGTLTLSGLSAYSFYLRQQAPKVNVKNRIFFGFFGAAFGAAAFWRATSM